MTAKPEEAFETIKSLAKRWKLSERTVRRLIDVGDLPVHRIGSQIRISQADREAFERRSRR